jgi:hypothetical protein
VVWVAEAARDGPIPAGEDNSLLVYFPFGSFEGDAESGEVIRDRSSRDIEVSGDGP